jgi:hypothetical protein
MYKENYKFNVPEGKQVRRVLEGESNVGHVRLNIGEILLILSPVGFLNMFPSLQTHDTHSHSSEICQPLKGYSCLLI